MDSVVLAAASAIWFAILVPVVARRVACPMAPLDGRGATLAFALVLVFSQVSLVFDVPRDDGTAVLDQGLSASNLLQVALTGASALYVALRVLIEPRLGRLPFAPPYLAMTLMIAYDGASALWSVVPSYTVYRTIEVATFSLATLVVFDRSSIERRLGPLLALSVAGWLVAAGPDLVLNLPRGIVFSAAKNNMMPLVCAALMLVALFEPATPRRPLLFAFGAVGFVLAGSAASTGALLAAFAPAMLIASPRRPLRLAGAALAALALVVMLGLILGLANVPSLLDLASTVLQKPPSELANATGRDEFWPLFVAATRDHMFGSGFAAADRFIQLLIPTGDLAANIGQESVNYASAHNMYLSTWAGTGVVGLGFCLFVLGSAFRAGLQLELAGRRIVTTLVLMLVLNGLTTPGIFQAWTTNNFAVLAVLAYARVCGLRRRPARIARRAPRRAWQPVPAE